jgi:hypothetical protein
MYGVSLLAGSLKMVARELVKYILDLMGVKEVRWDMGDMEIADDYTLTCGKGSTNYHFNGV